MLVLKSNLLRLSSSSPFGGMINLISSRLNQAVGRISDFEPKTLFFHLLDARPPVLLQENHGSQLQKLSHLPALRRSGCQAPLVNLMRFFS